MAAGLVVKIGAPAVRVNFDLHRAAGLWFWGVLCLFAWSGVIVWLNKRRARAFARRMYPRSELVRMTIAMPAGRVTLRPRR
ncbi:MAG TPA: hypothetical protein VLT86_16060 [Vicinamibacterales bacterium]|nr:hypothetical protein [Vicinamibacterales bacterium]